MSILNQILQRSKESKELIGLWRYNEDDNFWCGHVLDFNDTIVKIQNYTSFGKPDGVIIAMIENIRSVDFDDDHCNAMQVVIDYASELEKEDKIVIPIKETENWEYAILKQQEADFDVITSVELNNGDIMSGFILSVTENDFIIKCIGSIGNDQGSSIFKIEDITGFRINDIDNRKRALLYNWRNSKI
jgi:hypothetical protein